MNFVPNLGLRPSVVDSGIERCSELDPEAGSKNTFEENGTIPKAANTSPHSRAFLLATMLWPAPWTH